MTSRRHFLAAAGAMAASAALPALSAPTAQASAAVAPSSDVAATLKPGEWYRIGILDENGSFYWSIEEARP